MDPTELIQIKSDAESILKKLDKNANPLQLRHDLKKLISKIEAFGKYQFTPEKEMSTANEIEKLKNELEEERNRSEEKYRELFEAESDAIFLIDNKSGNIIEANKAAGDLYGYNHDEILKLKNFDLSAEPDSTKKITRSTPPIKSKVILVPLRYHKKKDGTIFPVEITGRFFIFTDQNVHIAAIRDITEKVKAEQAIQISNWRLKKAEEVAKIGHYEIDISNGTAIWSDETFRIFGLNKANGAPSVEEYEKYLHPDDTQMLYKNYEDSIQTGRDFELTYRVIHPSDGVKYIRSMGQIIIDPVSNKKKLFGSVQDISDIKKIEIGLRESQLRYKTLFTNANVGICITDEEGNFYDMNDAFCKLLKRSKKQILSMNVKHIYKNLSDRVRLFKKLEKSNRVINFKVEIVDKNQRPMWVNLNVQHILLSEQKVMFSILLDITKEVKAKNALTESEERFNLATKATNDGLYDWNLETNEIYFSPGWKKILGYKDHELENDFAIWEKLTNPEDVQASWKILNEHLKGKRDRYEMEFRMKHKKGHWVDILSRAEAIFNEKGKAIRVVGTHIDITERKRIEQKLKKQNEFIQTMLDNLPIGLATNEINEGTAIYMNKKFEEIYGWPEAELKDVDNFFNLVYPDNAYRDKIMATVMEDIESGDPSRMHWENLTVTHKDGSKRYINAVNIPLFEQNIMISTVMDITKLKEAETELKKHKEHLEELVQERTKELEQKNKELEHFNNLFIGREFRIKELKDRIKLLERQIFNKHN